MWSARTPRLRPALVTIVAAAGVTLLLLALTGVMRPHSGRLAVPTDDRLKYDSRGDYALLSGTVGAEQSGDRACVWVDLAPGTPSESKVPTRRYYLVMPPSWSADKALRVLNGDGKVLAEPGIAAKFLGAPGEVKQLPGCAEEGVTWFTPAQFTGDRPLT